MLGNGRCDVESYTQSVVQSVVLSWGEVVKLAENRTPGLRGAGVEGKRTSLF